VVCDTRVLSHDHHPPPLQTQTFDLRVGVLQVDNQLFASPLSSVLIYQVCVCCIVSSHACAGMSSHSPDLAAQKVADKVHKKLTAPATPLKVPADAGTGTSTSAKESTGTKGGDAASDDADDNEDDDEIERNLLLHMSYIKLVCVCVRCE
jgi:hypothetical protein